MDFISAMLPDLIGKKIVLYGADVTGLSFLIEAERNGLEIAYIVDGNKTKWGKRMFGKEIVAPYDLLYEDKEKIKIVLCAPSGKNAIVNLLEDMGYEIDNNIDVRYIDKKDSCDHIDIPLGISRGSKTIVNMADVNRCGKGLTILILGGSTSDPSYNGIHSWSYYLQSLLDNKGLDVTVLNGATIGYCTSQELLCLLRDGLRCKPDIVISYTGYNDLTPALDIHPGKRFSLASRNLFDMQNRIISFYREKKALPPEYFGEELENHFDLFEYNIRCMKALCDEFNAHYYVLFQPMLHNQKILSDSLEEKILHEDLAKVLMERFNTFYEEFKKSSLKYDYLYDFTSIFREETDVFSDLCHTNEKGNQIIAEKVISLLETNEKLLLKVNKEI